MLVTIANHTLDSHVAMSGHDQLSHFTLNGLGCEVYDSTGFAMFTTKHCELVSFARIFPLFIMPWAMFSRER